MWKRSISYSKYGEVFSKPPSIKTKTLYHPVLGKYQSELIVQEELSNQKLMSSIVEKYEQEVRQTPAMRYELGSTLFVQHANYAFMGIVIESTENFVRLRNKLAGTGVEFKIPLASPLIKEIKLLHAPATKVTHSPNLFEAREEDDKYGKRRSILAKERLENYRKEMGSKGLLGEFAPPFDITSEKGRSNLLRAIK